MRIEPAGSKKSVAAAAKALRRGGLVVLPTDTVYGLVADVRVDEAVGAIYRMKGKSARVPLQLLFADMEMAGHYAELGDAGLRFIEAVGPGGWTLVVRRRQGWSSPALAGGDTVGIRVPDNETVRAVVSELGAPLAASSANRHGEPSPRTAQEAAAGLSGEERLAVVLDAGPVGEGLDSTVIDLSGLEPVILREGAIDHATVARILGLSAIRVLRSVRP